MAIVKHTTQYSDAYLDISYYVPPHQYTPAETEMPIPVREFLIVSDLNDWFEDILDEAEEEIEVEAIADPIAYRGYSYSIF
uniref:Uncharacterized protein n=1 Tax=Magallana gigas TaxID=29159 RepID=A0A8W8N9F6_MAGGI